MPKEKSFRDYYQEFKRLPKKDVLKKLRDIETEMEPFRDRPQSEGFIMLDDSTNNLKHAVLIQVLEEHG